jgi:hypothetical protein
MHTQKGHGRPSAADDPWNEIVPHLWMGGHEYVDRDGLWTPAIVDREFDVVYSLHQREGYGPAAGVEDHFLGVPDDPLTAEQIMAVYRMAASVTFHWHSGRVVLVRCRAGLNRSGLVIAQVLINNGRSAEEAVEVIRTRRSPHALNNQTFVDYLTTSLDLSAQLTALGSETF